MSGIYCMLGKQQPPRRRVAATCNNVTLNRCSCFVFIKVSFTTKDHHCSLWPDAKTLEKSKWGYTVIHCQSHPILMWLKDAIFIKSIIESIEQI